MLKVWKILLTFMLLTGCSKAKVDDAISASANFSIQDYVPSSIEDGNFSNTKTETPVINFSTADLPAHVSIEAQVLKSNNGSVVKAWSPIKSGDRISGLSLIEGSTYNLKMRATTSSGEYSTSVWSDGWIVDTLGPSIVTNINDGTSSNSVMETPTISFSSAQDGNGAGVDKYYIQVLKSSDDSVVKSWSEFVNGSKVQNLSLVNNQSYKVQIKSIDKVGNESAVATSDGWNISFVVVDSTPPTAPSSVTDGQYSTQTTATPAIAFTAGTDADSGIQKHQAKVVKISDSSVVKDWFDFTSGSTITGLTLITNTQYRVLVRAVDQAGNISSEAQSDGWLVDATAPSVPAFTGDGNYSTSLTQSPTITFTAATDTGGSGILKHQIQILKVSDTSVIKDWTDFVSGSSVSGLTLLDGSTYIAKIKAFDNAGNISNLGTSDGWIVDTSAPSAPTAISHSATFGSLTASPVVTFTSGSDSGSGILKHQAKVIKSSDSSVIKDWFDFASGNAITGLTLVNGANYKVQVRAVDNLNQISNLGESSGWTVQTGASVTVNWTANKEKAVNSSGGGYKVYYSQTNGFNINTANFVDVPFVSGSLSPTTATITSLTTGTWYIKIIAYSSINGGSQSAVSAQTSVVVP